MSLHYAPSYICFLINLLLDEYCGNMYSMAEHLLGIGKKQRSQLALLIKANLPVITPKNAAKILKTEQARVAQLLALWAKKGWLSRVKHGVYVPVPLQAGTTEVMVDDPWIVGKALFDPCYIGGWSAAEYWDFTEQIFSSVMIFSTKKSQMRELKLKGVNLTIKTIKLNRLFGTKVIWREGQKISIADPSRTIVDAFNDPAVVGGIRMATDILARYLKSEHKNFKLLYDHASKMGNTAIFKRLGFILESHFPSESTFIEKVRKQIRSGYSQLDPSAPGKRLVTAWNLWVPMAIKKGSTIGD